ADAKRKDAEKEKAAADAARREADKRAKELEEAAFRLAVSAGHAADDAWEVGRVERANELLAEIPLKFRGFEWRYRQRLFQGGYMSLRGHTDAVTSVAFSPDGQRLASASHDKTVKVWESGTGKQLLTMRGHAHWVTGVAFSLD